MRRVYSPWPDLHKIMKEENIPMFCLESQEPVKNMDFLGITIQYEMCYTNILQILDNQFCAANRDDTVPIVSAAVPAPTIRNQLQTFSICFIWEKGRSYMTAC